MNTQHPKLSTLMLFATDFLKKKCTKISDTAETPFVLCPDSILHFRGHHSSTFGIYHSH